MEHSAHPTKRPRLTTPASWSSKLHGQGVSLPQPNPPHHPPAPGGPHHPLPPAQYTPRPPSRVPQSLPCRQLLTTNPSTSGAITMNTSTTLQCRTRPDSSLSHRPTRPIPLTSPKFDWSHRRRLPPTPHGPPHPNQHHPSEDPRRHMNFDNGASMPHSPALYRPPALPQAYHPPTSQQPPQHYDGPHNYGHPPQVYAALEIQNASAKRKPQRASQLKAKCDETKPCKNCREKNVECKYRDPPAKQPDKATTDILEILSFLKEEMSSMSAKFDKFDKMESRVCNLENMAIHGNPEAAKMKMESIEEDDQPNLHHSSMSDNGDMPEAEEEATGTSTPGRTSVLEPSLSLNEAHETLRQGDCDDVEAEPGPMVLPGRPAMPPNHTTLASLLLKWPSINKMLNHILLAEQIQYVEEYPIREEQRRGVLRLFGRGEGPDSDNRTSDKGTPQDLSTTDGEDASDVIAPTPGPELWGQVGSPAPGPGIDYKGGVLTADGNPDWDQTRILKYVRSFKDNILNMHPILIPKELDAMVRVFLDQLPKSSTTPSSNKASSFPGGTVGFIHPTAEVGAKRKRSPVADEPSPVMSFRKPGRPFRNIQSALVLLVFALGKICLHKGKIPDVVQEPDGFTSNSPLVRNGVLASPSQGSPGLIPPSSSGLPSPKENERAVLMSRRSSLQGGNNIPFSRASSTHKRNLDVIPGLEYFALASDIMGADYGGFCLKHVYVHILAGLYHGQLGRVLESWEHISTASRKLQVVLRPDILAELQLPQSGILAYESQMPYPNTEFAHAHGFPPHHYQTMEDEIDEIQRLLKSARNTWVPPDYRWKDDDPLPDDILAARLRAKYWGSQVILYRPFLRMILDGEAQPPPTYQNDHASPDAITPMGLNEKSRKVHDPRTIENAKLAIDALIESTRAFHGIHKDKRIIITNVFGTAHAQWGNLLTLAACYKDKTLCNYINVDTLSGLFSRTIAFFKEIAQPSSALHKDMNILISLAAELGFPHEEMDIRADSSFSSTTSSALLPPIYPGTGFYRGPSSPAMMRQH
ncbi:hypothetical protein EKO27_g745 [Xylaria grammica]|uniref:Zn(2)-C6 fungal-type domain-containing protein n=1 Tax=Xylaria grammica TaxID=363999 RepID=A0A439DIX5_9PEZI|nr:hypothetical protein EKO27_g745 [Xylaria grammica]